MTQAEELLTGAAELYNGTVEHSVPSRGLHISHLPLRYADIHRELRTELSSLARRGLQPNTTSS